eukprot:m.29589 g.29589  ORF g.29589 m.29589 type:complete len:103 (+) comp16128_c0_seq1:921-1229(+)
MLLMITCLLKAAINHRHEEAVNTISPTPQPKNMIAISSFVTFFQKLNFAKISFSELCENSNCDEMSIMILGPKKTTRFWGISPTPHIVCAPTHETHENTPIP